MERFFDVIIIGGGITGAGIARDAAMRELTVCLIEQKSFGGRTTIASTGLIHGGLRYQKSDVKITKLSCLDGGVILSIAPFLLKRQPFIVPIFQKDKHSVAEWDIFLSGYDEFQPLKGGKKHTRFGRDELFELEPDVERNNVVGAVAFDEWKVDPLKLTLANLASAKYYGATLMEHTAVLDVHKNLHSVFIDNGIGNGDVVGGRVIVNATGPFAELTAAKFGGNVKLRPTKGSHITINKRLCNSGIVAFGKDNKPVFIIPDKNTTVIGPTNVMFYGNPEKVAISDDETGYLLEILNNIFKTKTNRRDIVKTISGLRPQLYHWGVPDEEVTHDYAIYDHTLDGAPGIFTIVGGKMSTYRKMAQEMTDVLCTHLGKNVPCSTYLEMLPEISSAKDLLNPIPAPAKVTKPVYASIKRLALHSHREIVEISKKKKIAAQIRLLKFGIIYLLKKIMRRKERGLKTFKENYL